ncbi:cytochrome P450 [Mycena filopes]|nr:cytochrome P450 [Mycena filopes]
MSQPQAYYLAAGLALYALLWLAKRVYTRLTSPIRYLAGPARGGVTLGDVGQHMDAWRVQFGATFRYPGMFSTNLHTSDLLAVQHILKNVDIYQRPALVRRVLGNGVLGAGLLTIEGEEHRNLVSIPSCRLSLCGNLSAGLQRKIMVSKSWDPSAFQLDQYECHPAKNPAFGTPQMRELGAIFMEKAAKLRDNWLEDLSGDGSGSAHIDVLPGLRSMTLDVIALAGFNYDSHSLDRTRPRSELDKAFTVYFQPTASRGARLLRLVQLMFPILLHVPLRVNRVVQDARASLDRIARQVLEEGKRDVNEPGSAGGTLKTGRKDLLSLLLKVNVWGDGQRVSDRVVLAQIPTFLVAGHETTSTGTAWALYALAQHLAVQQQLRVELDSLPEDPTMEALNALPYLTNVVKEVLRLHPAIGFTVREAQREDVLPLGRACVDLRGRRVEALRIRKGQLIHIPILGVQRDRAVWGADAEEFRPERWDALPDTVKEVPGIYAHLLAFLGGAHACIGAKFAVFEMKSLLFTLVRAFEFKVAVGEEDIGRTTAPVGSPFVRSEKGRGAQMPLLVRPSKEV